jgi:hypothetical protein
MIFEKEIMAGTWVRLYPRKKVPIHVNCLILIDFFLFLDETGVVLVVPEENILTWESEDEFD